MIIKSIPASRSGRGLCPRRRRKQNWSAPHQTRPYPEEPTEKRRAAGLRLLLDVWMNAGDGNQDLLDRHFEEGAEGVEVIGRILESDNIAMVLEFKQSEAPFDGYYRQANKYRRRLKRFHEESDGMQIQAVLVLTRAKDFCGSFGEVKGCSPDRLGSELVSCFGDSPKKHSNICKWLNSEFSVRNESD